MGDLTAAARLDEALDAVEAALSELPPDARLEVVSAAMAEPVKALGAAAKALLLKREDGALEP